MELKTDSRGCFPVPDPCIFNGCFPHSIFFLTLRLIFSYFFFPPCTVFSLKVSQYSSIFHRMLLLLGNFMYGNNKSIKIRLTSHHNAAYLCMYAPCSFRFTVGLKSNNLYLPVETTYFPPIGVCTHNLCCRLWRLGAWCYFTSLYLRGKPSWISLSCPLPCFH